MTKGKILRGFKVGVNKMFFFYFFSSTYERKSNNKLIGDGSQDNFCIVDNAFMSIQKIIGNFKSGLPHGDIQIIHHNFAEIKVCLP